MTINVAVVTSEAVILGCDSFSSYVEPVIKINNTVYAKDAAGNEILDADGNKVIAVNPANVSHMARAVVGGASKMFVVYERHGLSVAAVTAGLAMIDGVTIAGVVAQIRSEIETDQAFSPTTVAEVVDRFTNQINARWHAGLAKLPPHIQPHIETVKFLVAGRVNHETPCVYDVDGKAGTYTAPLPANDPYGVTWGGMADTAERLLLGYDNQFANHALQELGKAQALILQDYAQKLVAAGGTIPQNFTYAMGHFAPQINFGKSAPEINYRNLPVQYAVELASLLVNVQSGIMRFSMGIPTVGGRTHVGVLERGRRFKLLNEPTLKHDHVGYAHGL